MNLLSLFNGISGGMLACERASLKIDKHYISEIDKYANQITMKNYPDSIQLGDITNWHFWDIDFSTIDIIISGFPCQSWSLAGKQLGDKDDRGKLFWTMLDIIKYVKAKNPDVKFVIENVRMKPEFEQYITYHTEQALGKVYKHLIDSALLSAQSRKRYYWTNIEGVTQPEDKGILLKDILETKDSPYIKISKKGVYKKHQDKASCLTGGGHSGGNHSDMDLIGQAIEVGHAEDINGHDFLKRIYSQYGKSPTLTAVCGGNQERKVALDDYKYRRLTPIECERLQTYPDNWAEGVSTSQRYKMLGNSFTVDVIAHILSFIKELK